MIRRPPRSTRTDTLFPYTPLFRSTDLVLCADTVATTLEQRFDLIIGNPPYGKLFRSGVEQLTEAAGNADLGGHTNLYALFLIKALDWLNPGGGLAFVLPTSFVAGDRKSTRLNSSH